MAKRVEYPLNCRSMIRNWGNLKAIYFKLEIVLYYVGIEWDCFGFLLYWPDNHRIKSIEINLRYLIKSSISLRNLFQQQQ